MTNRLRDHFTAALLVAAIPAACGGQAASSPNEATPDAGQPIGADGATTADTRRESATPPTTTMPPPSSCPPVTYDVDENVLSIGQGVYGRAVVSCDTEGCCTDYARDFDIGAFTDMPRPGVASKPVAIATTTSDGVFELPLATGFFALCGGERVADGLLVQTRCRAIYVDQDETLKLWFTAGPGGGRWTD